VKAEPEEVSAMSDDQFQASGNWWESARNVRFESGETQSSSSGLTNMGNYAWQHDMARSSSMDNSASGGSSVVFHDQKQLQVQPHHDSTATNPTNDHPNLHMMGLGLSSQAMDWNQASLQL